MVSGAFHKRSVPWATLFLVIGATVCQVIVLVSNCATADAMNALGVSTGGWAKVGKGVARSLHIELDHGMDQVSTAFVTSIAHLGVVQDSLDTVLTLLPGNLTLDFPGQQEPDRVLSLLQERQGEIGPGLGGGLAAVVRGSIHKAVSLVVRKVSVVLRKFMEVIKPALIQVGQWILQFGDRIQAGISIFSVTLDRVQKLMDHMMSQLAGHGDNREAMLEQTFGLFDASNTGYVTSQDLKDVARLYRITALQGDVPHRLTTVYDHSGDGRLDKEELGLLAEDEKLPNIMSAVLRTYGKRLAEVAGNVAAARHRDEVAQTVVDYLALVCAKNATKVSWIADRLGNGSLPMAFTADVMAKACLSEDSPDRLVTTSVGRILVSAVYGLHPDYLLQAVELMSNTSFWASSGLDVRDQPGCAGKVSSWITNSSHAKRSGERVDKRASTLDMQGLLSVLSDAHGTPVDSVLLDSIPERAKRLVTESVDAYSAARLDERSRRVRELHASQAPHAVMVNLLSGLQGADDVATPSTAEQAISSGQAASAETLEFATWLSHNASRTAKMLQHMCFVYSSESSSALDSYANQIQKMVAQVQAFLDSMMKYATPAGLDRLEKQIEDFEEKAATDLAALVEKKLFALVNQSLPALEAVVEGAAQEAGEWIGHKASEVIEGPLGKILAKPLASYISDLVQSDKAGRAMGESLGPDLARNLANMTADTLASSAGGLLRALVEKALERGAAFANSSIGGGLDAGLLGRLDDLLPGLTAQPGGLLQASLAEALHANPKQLHTSLLQLGSNESREAARRPRVALERHDDQHWDLHSQQLTLEAMQSKYMNEFEVVDPPEGTWGELVSIIKTLAQILPTSIRTVKMARKEVSKLSSNLELVFAVLDSRGQFLFETVAKFWRTLWIVYFCCLVPLHIYILYYGFWAGGFFGGPSPLAEDGEPLVEPPKTFRERLSLCWESCSVCMRKYHDKELCYWSRLLLLQVVVLILFCVSILMLALAGIKAFIQVGCTQMYVLGDESVCREELANLRRFLTTFFVREAAEPLYGACGRNSLLTCQLIQQKMASAGIVTGVFSAIGTLFGLHLVVNSAGLHEQARWRRLAAAAMRDSAQEDLRPGWRIA